MSRPTQSRTFAWWTTPTERAHRTQVEASAAAPQRRPFARPKPLPGAATQKAQILPFTGSNTPYESHE
jgi:hypothetical protein